MNQHIDHGTRREGQILAHATQVLGHHMADHDLPPYLTLTSPSPVDLHLDISVRPEHFRDWTLTGLWVTDSDITPVLADEFEQATCDGLLNGSGLRVRIRTVRPRPFTRTHLTGVPS